MEKGKMIKPDPEDYAAAEADPAYRGKSDADKYRLAQACKLIRLYRAGALSGETQAAMAELELRHGSLDGRMLVRPH